MPMVSAAAEQAAIQVSRLNVPPSRGAAEHEDADATTEPYGREGRAVIVKLDESDTSSANRSDPSLAMTLRIPVRESTSTPPVPFAS
jgi:hypothetical protein